MFPALLKQPTAVVGAIAIGAALAVSTFSVVRAERTQSHVRPNSTVNCHTTGVCRIINNTGPAFEATTSNANTRAFYVYATNSGADGTDINGGYIGIIARAPAGSGLYPLVLTDSNGTNLDYTNTNGDIYYHGGLNHFLRTRFGQRVVAYASETTTKTLEDVGSARLVNGQTTVVLDRTFAASIDMQSAYHVFLTPNGDTHGLYVAQKTANSFVVRETQGGRGSLSFDYRIVGSSLGHAGERMGATRLLPEPNAPVKR